MKNKDSRPVRYFKYTFAFWIDGKFRKFKAKDIDDDWLKHIIYFIAEGKGWRPFIENKKRINRIFKEAYKREICRPDILFTLHRWALFYNGFEDHCPRYLVDWDGKYIDLSRFSKDEDKNLSK